MKKTIAVFLTAVFWASLFAADVWIPGEETDGAKALANALQAKGMSVEISKDADLQKTRLIFLPPAFKVSDELRQKLTGFYQQNGKILVTDPLNLGAPAPVPVKIRPLTDFDPQSKKWRFIHPESALSWVRNGYGFTRNAYVSTEYFRAGPIRVKVWVPKETITSDDRLLVFDACGDYNSEWLTVVLVDKAQKQYVSRVDLSREWRRYTMRLADFVFMGGTGNSELEFLNKNVPENTVETRDKIDPASIVTVSLGISSRDAWGDKGGSFQVANLGVAEDAAPEADFRRSGYPLRYTVPLGRTNTIVPLGFLDPLDGGNGASVPARPVIRGRETDDKQFTDDMHRRAARRITLDADENGAPLAVISIPASEKNPEPAWGAVSYPASEYRNGGKTVKAAAEMAEFLLKKPHFSNISFDLEGEGNTAKLCAKLRIINPGAAQKGSFSVAVDGLTGGTGEMMLQPGVNEAAVIFGDVPVHFQYRTVAWKASLRSNAGEDHIADRSDAGEMISYLTKHLKMLQNSHRDGRWSHHYFADVYAARALTALGLQRNQPELVADAARMIHGLTSRQQPEGCLPMGYGEQRQISWVADNGTAVLALVQMASWLPEKREHYLDVTRRWYPWRESFRITPERAEKLRREFGENPETIQVEFYGIGYNDGPFYEKGKVPETIRIERGYVWTTGISMPSLPGYYQMTGDKDVLTVAKANLKEYLRLVGPLNYFAGEAVYWMYRYMPDKADSLPAKKALLENFLPRCTGERGYYLFEKGGRMTLDHLTLLYCMREFGATPVMRAALTRAMLNHGSGTSPYSIYRIGELYRHSSHGTSIAAARYAGSFPLVWLTELLYPGSTLMNDAQCRFANPAR